MLLPKSPFFHVAPQCPSLGANNLLRIVLRVCAENDASFFYYKNSIA